MSLTRHKTSLIDGMTCLVCRSSCLDAMVDVVKCEHCGQEYPVFGGVPVMFEAVSVEDGGRVDEIAARQVLSAFSLPADTLSVLRMRTLMRKLVRFGTSLIQVESAQFLDRIRNSGHAVAATAAPVADVATRDLSIVPRYAWPKSYMPRRITAGATVLANMRLENRGTVTLYNSGVGRVMIASVWEARGAAAMEDSDDIRTPLPIDILPGHAITVPVRIVAPTKLGAYHLTLKLLQEQVRWLDTDAITLTVDVVQNIPDEVPEGWVQLPDPPESYDADHIRGCAILVDWLQAHAPPRPRILEVGGNAVPMIANLNLELDPGSVNVDVDLLGLQVGQILARRRGTPPRQLCADAFDLPFPSHHFDAIVIFASLHHFPDPSLLLEHLRLKLRHGGFIGLFCEPVGHSWPGDPDPGFLAELERGVNEQSFSLREYELMFRRAELEAAEVVVDWNSMKARLLHTCPPAA